MPDEPQPLDELLRAKQVVKIVGRDLSTIWAWIKRGDFPAPVILNPGQGREIRAWRAPVTSWRGSTVARSASRNQ